MLRTPVNYAHVCARAHVAHRTRAHRTPHTAHRARAVCAGGGDKAVLPGTPNDPDSARVSINLMKQGFRDPDRLSHVARFPLPGRATIGDLRWA